MFMRYFPSDIKIEGFHFAAATALPNTTRRALIRVDGRKYDGFVFVCSGTAEYFVEGGKRSFSVCENDLFFLAKDEHYTISVPTDNYHALFADFTLSEESRAALRSDLCAKGQREYRAYLARSVALYEKKSLAFVLSCRIVLLSLFEELLKMAPVVGKEEANVTETVQRMRLAAEYMENNYNQTDLDADTLAGIAGYSEGYMRRSFRKLYRVTPMQYLFAIRIQHACDELSVTKHTVSDVAANCGFSTLGYFSEAFCRAMGVSPTEYARMNGESFRHT